jgi:hypothetical protein
MGIAIDTLHLNDACNACNSVDLPLNKDGYCAPCMKEERSGPRVDCDISVRNSRKADGPRDGFHKCKNRGRFYDQDAGQTRCQHHENKYNAWLAQYHKDMQESGYECPCGKPAKNGSGTCGQPGEEHKSKRAF